jgi:hypothetical protein
MREIKVNKDMMERACRKAGMKPEKRETINGREVFIADGFSAIPDITFKRFGVDKGEFPMGAYVTMWWVAKDEKLDVGRPILFDAFHDVGLSIDDKKRARINRAMVEASKFLKSRKMAKLNA